MRIEFYDIEENQNWPQDQSFEAKIVQAANPDRKEFSFAVTRGEGNEKLTCEWLFTVQPDWTMIGRVLWSNGALAEAEGVLEFPEDGYVLLHFKTDPEHKSHSCIELKVRGICISDFFED
jgi:hypothetical protein